MDTTAKVHDGRFASDWHMLSVGALTLVWYALGFVKFGVTGLDAANMSFWTQASLAACLWGGLAGAALLLVRSRFALQAMVVALVGMIVASMNLFILAEAPANLYAMPAVLGLWLITLVTVFYTSRVHALGLLR